MGEPLTILPASPRDSLLAAAEAALARLDEALGMDPVARQRWYADTRRRESSALAFLAGEIADPDAIAIGLLRRHLSAEAAQAHYALGLVLTDGTPKRLELPWLLQLGQRAISRTSGREALRFTADQAAVFENLALSLERGGTLATLAEIARLLMSGIDLTPQGAPVPAESPGRPAPRTADELVVAEMLIPSRRPPHLLVSLLLPVLAQRLRSLRHPALPLARVFAARQGRFLAALRAPPEQWEAYVLESVVTAANGSRARLATLNRVHDRWVRALGPRRSDSHYGKVLHLAFENGGLTSRMLRHELRISIVAAIDIIGVLVGARVVKPLETARRYRIYIASEIV